MSYIGNTLPANFQSLPAVQRFNGDGSDTTFTLAAQIANDQSILVSVDGVTQDSNAYSVSGTTLTFTSAPSAGTGNIFVNTISPVGSTITHPASDPLSASTGTFSGKITADAGIDIDNFNIDGTTIALSSGAMTLDAAGDIILDAQGANIFLKDDGTTYGKLDKYGNSFRINNPISDGDVLIQGNDGGSDITALTFDMSEAGYATFNNWLKVNDRVVGNSNLVLNTSDGNEKIHLDASGYIKLETAGSERMRIDSSGNVLISCTSTMDFGASDAAGVVIEASDSIAASRSGQATLWLKRFGSDGAIVNFYKSTSAVGSISVNGSATAYNTSSDYRLKENVDYTWDATTRLKQLKPARFNFKVDADTTVDGFLAHEAQAVVPECVTGTKDEVDGDGVAVMQGIDQSKLVPLLVKALQEQQAVIESLTTRITALEAE